MEEAAKPKIGGVAKTYPSHDCEAWNTTGYNLTPKYTAKVCTICNKITRLYWKSWKDRIKNLFNF